MNKQTGFVYFADARGVVKIGSTTSKAEDRILELSKEYPGTTFEYYHKIFTNDCKGLEKVFHNLFKSYNTTRELYKLSLKELEMIKEGNFNDLLKVLVNNEDERNKYHRYLKENILPHYEEKKYIKKPLRLNIEIEFHEMLEQIEDQTKGKKVDIANDILKRGLLFLKFYTNLHNVQRAQSLKIEKILEDHDNYLIIPTTDSKQKKSPIKDTAGKDTNINQFLLEYAYSKAALSANDKGDLIKVLLHIINRKWASERNLQMELKIKDRRGFRIINFLEILDIVAPLNSHDYNESRGGRKVNITRAQELFQLLNKDNISLSYN
ncbi:GIY-YIG nuclease family protein [Neobacillus sp. YIM B06451]|uniref:GIY-YIG nuclease family protein n=1 Tax=Neobacillus sp. YIM B06451 TaxID=3070994 RepID=UPI002931A3BC|nr:GIY-YIG nuclease family protein [Neobacillus sp. YIM B06451]